MRDVDAAAVSDVDAAAVSAFDHQGRRRRRQQRELYGQPGALGECPVVWCFLEWTHIVSDLLHRHSHPMEVIVPTEVIEPTEVIVVEKVTVA